MKATLIGGSGYIGGEVLRLLLAHPGMELVCVTGNESAGKRVDELQPNLRGFCDLTLVKHDEAAPADVTFMALPLGQAESHVPKSGKVIDLSGDHRIGKGWTTGIPEINREEIRKAEKVACGGCFASAAILGVYPVTSQNLHDGLVIVDGKTGSSGSGVKPKDGTLHAFRSTSLYGYNMFGHRHQPEIEQATGAKILFQPHSTPLVRGVFTTAYIPLKEEMSTSALFELFSTTYTESFFVRLQEGSPNVNWTKGSNFVDIGLQARGKMAIVFSAVDNLIKGGAGQAVQCMNLMFGFKETAGLMQAPAMP